jgi:ankyrin repeat protein
MAKRYSKIGFKPCAKCDFVFLLYYWSIFAFIFLLTEKNEANTNTQTLVHFSLSPAEEVLYAFSINNTKKVDEIIENEKLRLRINYPQNELGGETLLTHIIYTKKNKFTSLKEVSYLISKGIDPTITNIDGTTPLLASIETQDLLVSYFVLEYIANITNSDYLPTTIYDISRANDAGQTPLCKALEYNALDIVHILLDFGVTTRCFLKGYWCCNPLKIAVNVVDAVTMLKLLNSDSYSRNFMNDALNTAFDSGREDIIHVLLKYLAKDMSRNRLTGVLPYDAKKRLASLSAGMQNGRSSIIVDALLEIEIQWENPFLCGWVNNEGRTIFFTALYYGYKNITKRLMEFYDLSVKTRITGYLNCYADRSDFNTQCPSSVLLYSPKWRNKAENKKILKFLFSRRNPLTGENCLSNALRQKENVVTVFKDVGGKAARLYGSQVLDLAGLNVAGKDILLQVLETRAPQPVIILTLQWLLQGYEKGVTSYFESFKQGLLVALGGTGNLNDQFSERDTYVHAIEAATIVAPGYLYQIIFSIPLSNPNSELQYKRMMKSFICPFPLTNVSLLSQYVKASLSSLRLWSSRSTLKDFLQSHNENFFSPQHFTNALDTAAESSVINCEITNLVDPSLRRKLFNINIFLSRLALKLRLLLNSPVYTILIDDHIVNTEGVTRELYLRYYAVFQKRSSLLVELLRSPNATPNIILRHLSKILFCMTLIYGLTVSSLHSFIVYKVNDEPDLINVSPFIDMIPCAKTYWLTAFLEGLRRSFLIPGKGYIDVTRIRSNLVKLGVYLIFGFNWLSPVAFLWCIIEIWVLTQDTECHKTTSIAHSDGLIIKRISPIHFIFPCTLLVHTILAKMSSKEQIVWFCWFLFGAKSCKNFFKSYDEAVCQFYWLPKTKRQFILFLQAVQRLNVRDSIRSKSMRYNIRFARYRHYVQKTKRMGFGKKLYNIYKDLYTSRNTLCGRDSKTFDHSVCKSNKKANKNISSKENVNHNVVHKAQKRYRHQNVEDLLLYKCITEIQNKHNNGYLRDMLVMYTCCFVVAQFPLWRCFEKPFKMLYFDVYFSQAKFKAYMTSNSSFLLLREFCMFVVLWQELIQLSFPILQTIRIVTVWRIALKTIRKYPITSKKFLIPIFGESCDQVDSEKQTINRNADDKKLLSIAVLSSIDSYVEIRQSLFKQFGYIWEPIETALNAFCLYWGLVLLSNYTRLYKGMLLKNYFATIYSQLGAQLTLAFVWVGWIAVQALRTNLEFDQGWSTLQQANLQPHDVTSYRKGKRALFQAVSFFKEHEFRLTLASIRLSTTFAASYFFFYMLFFVEFCLIVPESN